MPTATLTSKGQITVPQAVRRALRLHPGTKVDFVPVPDGFKVVPLHGAAAAGLKGCFAGRAIDLVSIEAMNEAVVAEASARGTRGKKR